MDTSALVTEPKSLLKQAAEYYGHNDPRPCSRLKSALYAIVGTVLFLILTRIAAPMMSLGLIFIYAVIRFFLNDGQQGAVKVMTFEAWYKAPGKEFKVVANGDDSSDIIVSKELLDDNGKLHTCSQGVSLRKSIELTVEKHCREGPYAETIATDSDTDKPRYHLHGRMEPYDCTGTQLWTCPARVAQWSALYSWCGQLPKGLGWSTFSEAIDAQAAPDVLGYIYLLEVSNPEFYGKESRVARIGKTAINAPNHTPDTEGKIFARYGYRTAYYFGNVKTNGMEPDAYIFKGKTLEEAQMKIVHTYRIMKPVIE